MSYAIRDAIHAAKNHFPTQEADVANLYGKFKIKVKHDMLIFEPQTIMQVGNAIFESDVGAQTLANSLESMTIPDVQGVLEIVGACIKHKAPEFTFPDAELDEVQMHRLSSWANSSGYYIVKSKPLILRKGGQQDNHSQDGGLKLG